jgi:hypothetical protein
MAYTDSAVSSSKCNARPLFLIRRTPPKVAGTQDTCVDSIYKKWENLLSDNSQIWISPVEGDLKAPIINFIDNSTSLEDKD